MPEIWKFGLTKPGQQTIYMPKGAVIVSAKEQRGSVCIWAMVHPNAPHEEREIVAIGTGVALPTLEENEKLVFIETVLMAGGSLVWHVFEIVSQ